MGLRPSGGKKSSKPKAGKSGGKKIITDPRILD